MEANALTFAEAFDRDLRTYKMEQSQVSVLLSRGDPVPMSSAAISNWKARNRVPPHRLQMLVTLFGPESETARYATAVADEAPRFSRRPPPAERLVAGPQFSRRDTDRYFSFALQVPPQASQRHLTSTHPMTRPMTERERQLQAVIPEELQVYFLASSKIGGRVYRYDYISPRQAVSLVRMRTPASVLPPGLSRNIIRLLLLRESTHDNQRAYTIILVTHDPLALAEMRDYQKTQRECELLGITLVAVSEMTAAGQYIADAEAAPPSGPDLDDTPEE